MLKVGDGTDEVLKRTKEVIMKKRIVLAAVMSCLMFASTTPQVLADEHSKEGITHVKTAIKYLQEGIKHLEASLEATTDSHAERALKHAKKALKEAKWSVASAEKVK